MALAHHAATPADTDDHNRPAMGEPSLRHRNPDPNSRPAGNPYPIGATMHPQASPCASMWRVTYTDDSTSHLHTCELPPDHGATRNSGPPDHQCECGATHNGQYRPTCPAQRDGHTCTRIYWHTNRIKHRCHCGESFHDGMTLQRPLLVQSSQRAPAAPVAGS